MALDKLRLGLHQKKEPWCISLASPHQLEAAIFRRVYTAAQANAALLLMLSTNTHKYPPQEQHTPYANPKSANRRSLPCRGYPVRQDRNALDVQRLGFIPPGVSRCPAAAGNDFSPAPENVTPTGLHTHKQAERSHMSSLPPVRSQGTTQATRFESLQRAHHCAFVPQVSSGTGEVPTRTSLLYTASHVRKNDTCLSFPPVIAL